MKRTYELTLVTSLLLAVAACGAEDKKSDEAKDPTKEGETSSVTSDDPSKPEGTTGATGQVSVSFGNGSGAALLEEAAPAAATLKLSDAVTVTYAKASIAAIKVLGAKEPTADEKKKETEEAEAEKTDAAEVAALAEGGTSLTEEKAEKPAKPTPEEAKGKLAEREKEKREKIAAKKDELKKKAAERAEKEKKEHKGQKFHGPYVYDLVAGKLEGTAPAVDLADGKYRRIEFKLKRNLDVAETDRLFGHALVIQGTVKQGDADVPFTISVHHALNFRLKGDQGLDVVAGANTLQVVFDVTAWLAGVDLTKAVAGASGAIEIDNKNNRDLLLQIRKNIKKAARFGKDGKGDETTTETMAASPS